MKVHVMLLYVQYMVNISVVYGIAKIIVCVSSE